MKQKKKRIRIAIHCTWQCDWKGYRTSYKVTKEGCPKCGGTVTFTNSQKFDAYLACKKKSVKMRKKRKLMKENWISLEERFPQNYKDVLVCFDHGKIPMVCYCVGNEWFVSVLETEIDNADMIVTHWMPLPKLLGKD